MWKLYTFDFFSLLCFLDFFFRFLPESLLSSLDSETSLDFFFCFLLDPPKRSDKGSGLHYIHKMVKVNQQKILIQSYHWIRVGEPDHAAGTPMVPICSLSFLR